MLCIEVTQKYIRPAANTGGFYELLFPGKRNPLDSYRVACTRHKRRRFLYGYL